MTQAFNIDCMDAMSKMKDNEFDLAIVDPPYGINIHKKFTHKNEINYVKQKNGKRLAVSVVPRDSAKWDTHPPGKDYFNELFRVSKNQIIWGANNFTEFIPKSTGWIIWDKLNETADQSDAELAFSSFNCGVKKFVFAWRGMIQGSIGSGKMAEGNKKKNEKKIHPTQKPTQLYKWLLKNYAKEGDRILDTHLGSGSSRIAAYDMGFDFVGYEIDKDYFEAEEKRFANHIQQGVIFQSNEMY